MIRDSPICRDDLDPVKHQRSRYGMNVILNASLIPASPPERRELAVRLVRHSTRIPVQIAFRDSAQTEAILEMPDDFFTASSGKQDASAETISNGERFAVEERIREMLSLSDEEVIKEAHSLKVENS